MSSFTNQTEDIIINILSRLPVKSIGRFRCVSKTWYNLLNNPHFIKTQLEHAAIQNNFSLLVVSQRKYYSTECIKIYSLDYDSKSFTYSNPIDIWGSKPKDNTSVDIWGSCNGLVCFTSSALKGFVCVWNPSTKESKKIPVPSGFDYKNLNINDGIVDYIPYIPYINYGFGYDCNTEDYTLVRIGAVKSCSELDVFTLRTNSWKIIKNVPYKMSYGVILIFNGALHWIANPNGGTKETIVLATYEIGDGRFKDMPLPKDFDDKVEIVYVGVLGGCLCLTANLYKVHTEVWVMKDYGVQESWTRLFIIDRHTSAGSFKFLKLLQPLKNGDIMFQKDRSALFLYDPDQGEATTSKIPGITPEICTWAYSPSLVSPNYIASSAQGQIRQA